MNNRIAVILRRGQVLAAMGCAVLMLFHGVVFGQNADPCALRPQMVQDGTRFIMSVVDGNGNQIAGSYYWKMNINGAGWQDVPDANNAPSYAVIFTGSRAYQLTAEIGNCEQQSFSFYPSTEPPPPPTYPPLVANDDKHCGPGELQMSVQPDAGFRYEWYVGGSDEKLLAGGLAGTLSTGESYAVGGLGDSELRINFATTSLRFWVARFTTAGASAGGVYVNGEIHPFPEVSIGAALSVTMCNTTPATPLTGGTPAGGVWQIDGNTVTVLEPGNLIKDNELYAKHKARYTYTTIFGCSRYEEREFTVRRITAPVMENVTILMNTGTILKAEGAGEFESYRWYSADGQVLKDGLTYRIGATSHNTMFKVSKTNNWGCESAEKVSFMVIPNKPPYVSAGDFIAKEMPVGEVVVEATVYDEDGTISGMAWKQVSGPSVTMAGLGIPTLRLTNLVKGLYIFRLTAADNYKFTAYDEVIVEITDGSNDYNYVREHTARVKDIKSQSDLVSKDVQQHAMTTTYYDGLGRQVQATNWRDSPLKKDLVSGQTYDELGRPQTVYLPYAANQSNGNFRHGFVTETTSFYNAPPTGVATDTKPFAVTVFEPSPLNRVMKQGAQGAAWQPDNTPSLYSDRSVKVDYVSNASGEVRLWRFNATTKKLDLSNSTYYDAGALSVSRTYDENNRVVIEYKDEAGRVVLKRVQAVEGINPSISDTNYAATYYIYNDRGSLVAVLPPEAVKALNDQQ